MHFEAIGECNVLENSFQAGLAQLVDCVMSVGVDREACKLGRRMAVGLRSRGDGKRMPASVVVGRFHNGDPALAMALSDAKAQIVAVAEEGNEPGVHGAIQQVPGMLAVALADQPEIVESLMDADEVFRGEIQTPISSQITQSTILPAAGENRT